MNKTRPIFAAVLIVFLWAGWITISRYGVHAELTPADITLLRYLTAVLVVSPFVNRFPWKNFPLYQYLVVGLGVGFPYTLATFYGLMEIHAAHAGVLVNGMLPVFGAMATWLIFQERVSRTRYMAIIIIFLANIVMTGGEFHVLEHLFGVSLLLGAAAIYTFHMIGVRLWQFTWKDVLVVVPVVNAVLFIPIWFFMPSTNFQVSWTEIITQSLYQGVAVNVISLSCVAYAIRHLGTLTVSLYMSFVPVATAVFAWIFLGEQLTALEIAGIAGCTCGLVLYGKGQAIHRERRR